VAFFTFCSLEKRGVGVEWSAGRRAVKGRTPVPRPAALPRSVAEGDPAAAMAVAVLYDRRRADAGRRAPSFPVSTGGPGR